MIDTAAVVIAPPVLELHVDQTEVHAGQDLQLHVDISNFLAGEETFLFFSFHRDDYPANSNGVPILQTKFVVPSQGDATVSVTWHVPWDTRFVQSVDSSSTTMLGSRISVRASNRLTHVVFSEDLTVIADSTVDGIISVVAQQQGEDNIRTVQLAWNPQDLALFVRRRGSIGHGSTMTIQDLAVDFVQEYLDKESGEILRTNTSTLATINTASNQLQPGQVSVQIPQQETLPATMSSRSFFVLRSVKLRNLCGFSAGYFSTVNMQALRLSDMKHKRELVFGATPRIFGGEEVESDAAIEEAEGEEVSVQRNFQSVCSGCDGITYSLSFDGTLTDVQVCDLPFSIGLSTGSINLIEPTCVCLPAASSYAAAVAHDEPVDSVRASPMVAQSLTPDEGDGEDVSYYALLVAHGDDVAENTISIPSSGVTSSGQGSNSWTHETWFIPVVSILSCIMFVAFAAVIYYRNRNRSDGNNVEDPASFKDVELPANLDAVPTINPMASED